jgi:hypothetical protein
MKKRIELILAIIGAVCFIFIPADSLLHYGFKREYIDHGKEAMPFLTTQQYWILNLLLSTVGGLCLSLSRPIIGALVGLFTGVLLQITFSIYLFWRESIDSYEILFPLIPPLIIGKIIYDYIVRKSSLKGTNRENK